MQALERLRLEGCQLPALDRGTRSGGELEEEAQIVHGEQAQAEQLLLVHEVPYIGAREPGAGGAVTALVERALVAREGRVLEVEAPGGGQRRAGAPHSRGQHAVEH